MLSHAKTCFVGVILFGIVVDVFIVIPALLASMVLAEYGVYTFLLAFIWSIGRVIVRLIAFPVSTGKVQSEVESEFAKYMIRMLDNSCECIMECTMLLLSQDPNSASFDFGSDTSMSEKETIMRLLNSSYGRYDLIPLWRKSCSYRNRVLGMLAMVLDCFYGESTSSRPRSSSSTSDATTGGEDFRTKYNNNRIMGDCGDLSQVTGEAIQDGQELYKRLHQVLDHMDQLEYTASAILLLP